MADERYFIGPGLRDKLRETITRVDGIADRESGGAIPTVHQEMGARGGRAVRIGSFTGSWPIDQQKVVTLRGTTATLSALNLFSNISVDCGTRECAVAKDGTAWYLIAARCT